MNNELITITNKIKEVESRINAYTDQLHIIYNKLYKQGIRCNIKDYTSNKEALEYISIDNKLNTLELEYDALKQQQKELYEQNWNNIVQSKIKEYNNNKYKVILKDNIIYTNDINKYIESNQNTIIYTLINNTDKTEVRVYKKEYDNDLYNNYYNSTCKLETINNYKDDVYFTLDEILKLNDKIILEINKRYDNSNNLIYSKVWHNDNNYTEKFMNSLYVVEKNCYNGIDKWSVQIGSMLDKKIQGLTIPAQDLIKKTIAQLNRQGYKLDINNYF